MIFVSELWTNIPTCPSLFNMLSGNGVEGTWKHIAEDPIYRCYIEFVTHHVFWKAHSHSFPIFWKFFSIICKWNNESSESSIEHSTFPLAIPSSFKTIFHIILCQYKFCKNFETKPTAASIIFLIFLIFFVFFMEGSERPSVKMKNVFLFGLTKPMYLHAGCVWSKNVIHVC